MLTKDSKVVVSGFGRIDYPNHPTFQEVTTLENSLILIKEHLETQTEYPKHLYEFAINNLDDTDFIYSYCNGEISFAEEYENLRNCLKE